MKSASHILAALAMLTLFGPIAMAQNMNQFWLAAQHDWGGSRGFFFVLTAPYSPEKPAELGEVKVVLGVGDSRNWHYLSGQQPWKLDTKYSAKAIIKNGSAELWIENQRVAKEPVSLAPAKGIDLGFNQQPSFLRGPANYEVRETRLSIQAQGQSLTPSLQTSSLPAQLRMFDPAAENPKQPLDISDSVTIEVEFSFVKPTGDVHKLAPFIDRYGQSIHADWPAKVRSDDDLKTADTIEAKQFSQWGQPDGFDQYGGVRSSWSQKPTGFFAVARHDGKWWLISPDGNPCFYIGLCDAPALDWESTPTDRREFLFEWLPDKQGQFAPAWRVNPWTITGQEHSNYLAFHTVNLIRKYGEAWQQRATASAVARAKMLGFSGFAKWSSAGLGVSDLPVLFHGQVPNLSRHPDVFDPAIRDRWTAVLKEQIQPRKSDPWLLGWSVGNEHDECISADEITAILAMGDDVPAKRAMIEFGKAKLSWSDAPPAKPSDDEIEQLRRFYADRYYDFIYRAVKSVDPNHLYFGMWVTPNWWVNSADWASIAPHCDVIGYDFYAPKFESEPAASLIAANDKPVLCGEFSSPPHYSGTRGFGRYPNSSTDEQTSGQFYAQWIHDAAKNPQCVGVCYFQYRDQPLTGRGPADGSDGTGVPTPLVQGEHFAFGLVDVTDRLKWDFVRQVRAANLSAARIRLGGE